MQDRIFWAERRESPRYFIDDGAMKITGIHTDAATTRLLDLNRNGLSFQYMSVNPLAEEILQIDLLVVDRKGKEQDLFLHSVKGQILSVTEVPGIWGKKGGKGRRYGLRFIGLSQEQHANLKHFWGWNTHVVAAARPTRREYRATVTAP